MKTVQKILFFFELRSFGVSQWLANIFSIRAERVRLFFIYASFVALGSPLIIYFVLAFLLEHQHLLKFQKRKKSIWEL
ncbi:MAG: PspC family transcriptional regulator [Crocinitomicaceae bacterium]|nr:PspC family transcriptional regulator [Crocinitomicaceae bacterium]